MENDIANKQAQNQRDVTLLNITSKQKQTFVEILTNQSEDITRRLPKGAMLKKLKRNKTSLCLKSYIDSKRIYYDFNNFSISDCLLMIIDCNEGILCL
jgi:hypothetical protein